MREAVTGIRKYDRGQRLSLFGWLWHGFRALKIRPILEIAITRGTAKIFGCILQNSLPLKFEVRKHPIRSIAADQ